MSDTARALENPREVLTFDASTWENLIGELRSLNMLARMAALLRDENLLHLVPDNAATALEGASTYVNYIQSRARFEVSEIGKLAAAVDYPVVLLKGVAYLVTQSPASRGRGLSDIDILVPREHLSDFELRLEGAGWKQAEELNDYDNYYYRELSHEVPPKRNPRHQLELDLHHNLLQPTHRIKVDIESILAASLPVKHSPFHTLALEDQILHSATHLMMSDELRGGLRDLHDIYLLFCNGVQHNTSFTESLIDRAFKVGLARPLYYALDSVKLLFGISIDQRTWGMLQSAAPSKATAAFMRKLILRRVSYGGRGEKYDSWAEQALYIRSHWIRMPPAMLLKHLGRKATLRKVERGQ